jgi:hypothetical protein
LRDTVAETCSVDSVNRAGSVWKTDPGFVEGAWVNILTFLVSSVVPKTVIRIPRCAT